MENDDDVGKIPIHFVALGGLARVMGWLLAIVVAAIVLLATIVVLIVVTFKAAPDSFLQSLTSDVAVTLILFGAAPFLFEYWRLSNWRALLLSLLGAAGVVAISAFIPGPAQSLVMGIGCGAALLLVLDFWIHGAWERALQASADKAADEHARSTIVIGQ
jgi:hypothetical protein